jgi:hypothetical protein
LPPEACGECNFGCEEQHCLSCWAGAEWLHWRVGGADRLPPLVTAGPVGTPINTVARLDDPSTIILAGHEQVNDDWRNGYRLSAGMFFDCCRSCGVGVDYFDVGDDDFNFTQGPNPNFVIGRPFFNTELGIPDVQLVSVPNELDGTIHVNASDEFRGAGLTGNYRLWQWCDPCCQGHGAQLTMLSGYRFYKYDSNLSVTENLTVLPGTMTVLVPGTTFFVQDRFRTENEFNGGEIGIQGIGKHCWWWLDGMAKVAMGQQQRNVSIDGTTVITVPNVGTVAAAGGLLTSSQTNIGEFHDSDFVFIPEFRLGGGVKVTKCCSLRAGYDVIIWSDVARAASQLPRSLQVDPRNLPPVQPGGGPDPAFAGIRGSELIAHGLDVSVAFQW